MPAAGGGSPIGRLESGLCSGPPRGGCCGGWHLSCVRRLCRGGRGPTLGSGRGEREAASAPTAPNPGANQRASSRGCGREAFFGADESRLPVSPVRNAGAWHTRSRSSGRQKDLAFSPSARWVRAPARPGSVHRRVSMFTAALVISPRSPALL